MSVTPTVGPLVTIDLLSWQEGGSLELTPKFQRKTVWSPAAKSYLIDSILNGYPVPPIHIRMGLGRSGLPQRQVIDGQQRLHTVFDFVRGKFSISNRIDSPWAGRRFEDLDADGRERVLLYKFYVYQYDDLLDEQVLEIFARLNTYSVSLNRQELRNGKYFGAFKSTAYDLAIEQLEFWRDSGLFTETAIARMRDAELVSELLVLVLAGPQDKKTSLDSFYAALDVEWGPAEPADYTELVAGRPNRYRDRRETAELLRSTLSLIEANLGPQLRPSLFTRGPMFYSLFQVVAHHTFGIPGWNVATPHRNLSQREWDQLSETIQNLGETLRTDDQSNDLPRWAQEFVVAASRQTDNLAPRMVRANTIWERARFGDA